MATTAANPYRINQDYLLPMGPTDYFTEVTDDKDDNILSKLRPRAARPPNFRTPVKSEPDKTAAAESTEALPADFTTTEGATRPPRARKMRALTPDERAKFGPYRMMTEEKRRVAPSFKEISPKMAKTHICPSEVFSYNQE